MRTIPVTAVILVLVSVTGILQADDAADAIPEAVYIDPAAFLPEAFGQVVENPVENVPLIELAPLIGDLAGMPCRVALHELEELRISPEAPVTLHAGVPLYMALDRMCWKNIQRGGQNGVRFSWAIDRGILHLTTQRAEEDMLQLRTYDVADIIARSQLDEAAFEDILLHHTRGAEWVDHDGLGHGGDVSLHGSGLIVRQSFQAHRKIAALLAALRTDAQVVYVDRAPEMSIIETAFDQPIRGRLDGVALNDVLRVLADQTDIEFAFDPSWSVQEVSPHDTTSDYSVTDRDLRTTLDLLLAGVKEDPLSYYVRHHVIWIASEHDLRNLVEYSRDRMETFNTASRTS